MKKLILVLAFSILSAVNAFGYYDATAFYTALYYPQAAYFMTDRIGVLVGTNNFRFMATILSTYPFFRNYEVDTNTQYKFTSVIPSAFVGFAYTNSDKWFGIGGGYELDHYEEGKSYGYMAHTPVIALSFLENHALKINIPVSIGHGYGALNDVKVYSTLTHARYSPNSDIVQQLRFYVYYGHLQINKPEEKISADSLGFNFGIYFHAYGNDNFSFDPYLTVGYFTSLKDAKSSVYQSLGGLLSPYNIQAITEKPSRSSGLDFVARLPDGFYAEKIYRVSISPRLGLTASSDFVTVYGEPIFSYNIYGGKNMRFNGEQFNVPLMEFSYGVYVELYITPTKDITLFLEADMRGNRQSVINYKSDGFSFDSSSGIQWSF